MILWSLRPLSLLYEGVKKETSRRPRNRNQCLYIRNIGPGCWGTSPTATQRGEWLSRKIPGAALWTSSGRTAWRRRPRWIACSSEPFLGDQKWHNRRDRDMDYMEGDREPPTWISARVPWLSWPYEALIVVEQDFHALVGTTLCYTWNDIVTGLHIPEPDSFLFERLRLVSFLMTHI